MIGHIIPFPNKGSALPLHQDRTVPICTGSGGPYPPPYPPATPAPGLGPLKPVPQVLKPVLDMVGPATGKWLCSLCAQLRATRAGCRRSSASCRCTRQKPHPRRDWAHPSQICAGTALTLPHLHRGRARPSHICAGTGLTSPTSALGLGPPLPHLRADWAHPRHITGVMQWANWARLAILSTTQNLYALAAPTLARITADVGFHVGLDLRFEPEKFDALLLDRLGSVGMLLVVLVCCVAVGMLHVAWVCCTNMLHVALVHRMGMLRGYGSYCRLHVAWNIVLHRHVACSMLPHCAAHISCGMVCMLHAERCR